MANMDITHATPKRSVSSDPISSERIKEAILQSGHFDLNNSYDKISIQRVGSNKILEKNGSALSIM